MVRVLRVYVFRSPLGDSTIDGITSNHDALLMFIDCSREEAMKYCEENNVNPEECLMLVRRVLWGEKHDWAEPLVKPKGASGMMGGNFVYTSDSRMHDWALSWQPIPVHDRFEMPDEYEQLSM